MDLACNLHWTIKLARSSGVSVVSLDMKSLCKYPFTALGSISSGLLLAQPGDAMTKTCGRPLLLWTLTSTWSLTETFFTKPLNLQLKLKVKIQNGLEGATGNFTSHRDANTHWQQGDFSERQQVKGERVKHLGSKTGGQLSLRQFHSVPSLVQISAS